MEMLCRVTCKFQVGVSLKQPAARNDSIGGMSDGKRH